MKSRSLFYKIKNRKEQEYTESKALVRRQFHWFEVLKVMHRKMKRERERETERQKGREEIRRGEKKEKRREEIRREEREERAV